MIHNTSHSCIVDHDEMKNNFKMKDTLNLYQFQNQNQEKYLDVLSVDLLL